MVYFLRHVRGYGTVDKKLLLSQLEELAQKLNVKIRYVSIKKEDFVNVGGLCRIKDEYIVILNSKSPTRDKIHTLAQSLRRFDLSTVYVLPALREFMDTLAD